MDYILVIFFVGLHMMISMQMEVQRHTELDAVGAYLRTKHEVAKDMNDVSLGTRAI